MQTILRTFALSAALLALTGTAFASSPGGTNPVPPPSTAIGASSPGGTNPVPPPSSSTDLLAILASLLGL